MEKQFGKPLILKGLENGDLGDQKYSIARLAQSESGKNVGGKFFDHSSDAQSKKGKKGGRVTKDTGKLLIAASKSGKRAVETGRIKEVSSAGGKVSGLKNVESGHLAKISQQAQKKAQEQITCKHCGKIMNRINHGKYHGDRCKLKA